MPALLDMTTHLWAIGWSWWGVGSVPPPEATPTPGIAPVVPPVPPTNPPVATVTDHALLVLLGAYAQNLGRIDQPAQVPLAQRTYDHAPQEKLIQFLVGILGGIDYLQDFDAAAHPRTRDPLVAQAWGQTAFAHYSGVSRNPGRCRCGHADRPHPAVAGDHPTPGGCGGAGAAAERPTAVAGWPRRRAAGSGCSSGW